MNNDADHKVNSAKAKFGLSKTDDQKSKWREWNLFKHGEEHCGQYTVQSITEESIPYKLGVEKIHVIEAEPALEEIEKLRAENVTLIEALELIDSTKHVWGTEDARRIARTALAKIKE